MVQKLDMKTRDLLEQKGLNLDDFSVEFSIRQCGYSNVGDEEFVQVSFYNHYESDEVIGTASFLLYDAKNIHVSTIRDMADGNSFYLYQSVSSVRIYNSEDEAEFDKMIGFQEDPNGNTPWLEIQNMARQTGIHLFPYDKGFEQGTFEGLPYHLTTQSVWGRVLVLDDITIQEEYRTNAITSAIFKNMMGIFNKVGLDWLIINPNISEDYMKDEDYPFDTQDMYNEFLINIGFIKTHGRLHNDEFCWCFELQK